jgi:hypothetical protein
MIYPCQRKQYVRPDRETVCSINCSGQPCHQPEQTNLPTNSKPSQRHNFFTPTNTYHHLSEVKKVTKQHTENDRNIPNLKCHTNFQSTYSPHQQTGMLPHPKKISAPNSLSRPIYTSSVEIERRNQELSDLRTIERLYANATWRMYDRIITYRERHPLPDDYFCIHNNNIHETTPNEEVDTSNCLLCNKRNSHGVVEDEPFMMFELDML